MKYGLIGEHLGHSFSKQIQTRIAEIEMQQYILDGKPIEGVIRFFAGYAGWDHGQLAKEIKENSWLIGKAGKETLLNQHFRDLWHTSLNEMGGKYAIWARYPQYPSLN